MQPVQRKVLNSFKQAVGLKRYERILVITTALVLHERTEEQITEAMQTAGLQEASAFIVKTLIDYIKEVLRI